MNRSNTLRGLLTLELEDAEETAEAEALLSAKVGDLHLLLSVEDQILLVLIVKIGHRGSV